MLESTIWLSPSELNEVNFMLLKKNCSILRATIFYTKIILKNPTFYKFQEYNEKIRMIWENLHIIHKPQKHLILAYKNRLVF
jgi:hypothetical protein